MGKPIFLFNAPQTTSQGWTDVIAPYYGIQVKDSNRLSSNVTGILWANLGCKLRRQLLHLSAEGTNHSYILKQKDEHNNLSRIDLLNQISQ